MLKECKEVKPGSRYHRIKPFLENDARWKAVRSHNRERWLHDFVEKLEKERIERRRAASQKLKDLVVKCEEITHSTIYREFQKLFEDNEIYQSKELSNEDRRSIFREHVDRLRRQYEKEEERKRKAKERKRKEEDQAFMQLLREKSFQCNPPLFHAKTQYDEFAAIDEVKEDPRFKALQDSGRADSAFRTFDTYCWNMDADLKPSKKELKSLIRNAGVTVQPTHTIPDLKEALSKPLEKCKIKEAQLRLLLLEMIAKAKHKAEEAAKKGKDKDKSSSHTSSSKKSEKKEKKEKKKRKR